MQKHFFATNDVAITNAIFINVSRKLNKLQKLFQLPLEGVDLNIEQHLPT